MAAQLKQQWSGSIFILVTEAVMPEHSRDIKPHWDLNYTTEYTFAIETQYAKIG